VDHSTCVIDGCKNKMLAKFLCSKHYHRLRSTGTTRLIPKPKKKCRMPGCDNPSRKLRWCAKHYDRIQNTGSPFDKDQKWVWGDRGACEVCGGEVKPGIGYRRYCGLSCAHLSTRGERLKTKPCALCGEDIDLTVRSRTGVLKNSATATCSNCTRPNRITKYIPEIVARDGSKCSICSGHVDLTIEWPDPRYKSVDHIIPRSKGGADHIDNYALAHYRCNALKRDRVGWKMSTPLTI